MYGSRSKCNFRINILKVKVTRLYKVSGGWDVSHWQAKENLSAYLSYQVINPHDAQECKLL